MWGSSATSWRSIYRGVIRAVAMWGAELGWRGQSKSVGITLVHVIDQDTNLG